MNGSMITDMSVCKRHPNMRQTGRKKFQPSEYFEAVNDDYDDNDCHKGDDDVAMMRNAVPDRLCLT